MSTTDPRRSTEQIPKAQRGEFKGYGEAQISPTTLIRFTEYLHKNMFFRHKRLWDLFLPSPRELSKLTGTFCFINISSSSWNRPAAEIMCAVELRKKNTTIFHHFLSWQAFPVHHQFFGTHLWPGLATTCPGGGKDSHAGAMPCWQTPFFTRKIL